MLLEVKDLKVVYEKATAVHGVSLNVDEGEVVAIVGANGASKTTILRTISGLKKAATGEIWFRGKRIDHMPAYTIVKAGIAQIPAERQIFADMSVLDNIKIGAYLRRDTQEIKHDIEYTYEHFPRLREKSSFRAGNLSGGEQQMLAIARALMARPKLLLMDEPSIGLSPIMVMEVSRIIENIKNTLDISILLVEQNCRLALKLSNRAYILELGRIALQGPSCELGDNELVRKCYLGG